MLYIDRASDPDSNARAERWERVSGHSGARGILLTLVVKAEESTVRMPSER